MKKKSISLICILTMCSMIFASMPMIASAATKSRTYSNRVLDARGPISLLDVYGKDTVSFKYDGRKVISSTCGQSSKNLGTHICEKGGIKVVTKTSKYHTCQSVWYLNFDVMPEILKKALGKFMGKGADLTNLGRFATATTRYTVYYNGTVKKSTSVKWYAPKKLQKIVTFAKKYLLIL